jgi:hypothetical protein
MKTTLLLTLFAACTAHAALVLETESNGAAANNSTSTAQAIPGTSLPATIQGKLGGDDVDFYSFQNTFAGSLLFLDVDNDPATFDSIIAVFNAAGTLIGYGDDTAALDAGSASTIDALLAPLVLSQVGTYFIAISEFPNYPKAALLATETALGLGGRAVTGATAGLSDFDFNGPQPTNSLAYRLQATVVTPEPATFLLGGLGLLALGLVRRRK